MLESADSDLMRRFADSILHFLCGDFVEKLSQFCSSPEDADVLALHDVCGAYVTTSG